MHHPIYHNIQRTVNEQAQMCCPDKLFSCSQPLPRNSVIHPRIGAIMHQATLSQYHIPQRSGIQSITHHEYRTHENRGSGNPQLVLIDSHFLGKLVPRRLYRAIVLLPHLNAVRHYPRLGARFRALGELVVFRVRREEGEAFPLQVRVDGEGGRVGHVGEPILGVVAALVVLEYADVFGGGLLDRANLVLDVPLVETLGDGGLYDGGRAEPEPDGVGGRVGFSWGLDDRGGRVGVDRRRICVYSKLSRKTNSSAASASSNLQNKLF